METKRIQSFLEQAVVKHHAEAIALSDDLAAHPELPDQEFRSSGKMVDMLRQAGYEVEFPYLERDTAFRGVLDNGEGPSVAIMVEYDALPELGHACGHNVHGSMAILTALALAECRDQYKGKVYVFGTPAEEERGGKVIMADQGAFDGMAVAVMIHSASGGKAMANMDVLGLKCYEVKFTGVSAHAACSPWDGHNALTAARKFLDLVDARRESFTLDTRFSGVILDGGKAPNIIPDRALVRVEFRADSKTKLERMDDIVHKCANGTAMAMDCEVSFKLELNFADMVRVSALEREAVALLEAVGQTCVPVPAATGSSDVGNVSYHCPTIQAQYPICQDTWALHTTKFEQETTREPAHQAIAGGALVMAQLVWDVLTDQKLRKEIHDSFEESKKKKEAQ